MTPRSLDAWTGERRRRDVAHHDLPPRLQQVAERQPPLRPAANLKRQTQIHIVYRSLELSRLGHRNPMNWLSPYLPDCAISSAALSRVLLKGPAASAISDSKCQTVQLTNPPATISPRRLKCGLAHR